MRNPQAKLKFTFERKLYTALLVLLVSLIALVYYSYTSLISVSSQQTRLTDRFAHALHAASDLRYLQAREDTLVLRMFLTADPSFRNQITIARKDFLEATNVLQSIDPDSSTISRLNQIRAIKSQMVDNSDARLALRARGAPKEKTLRAMDRAGLPLLNRINSALIELYRYELSRFGAARESTFSHTLKLIRGFVFLSLLTGAGFVLIAVLLVRLAWARRTHDLDRELIYEEIKKTAQARKEVLEAVSHDLKNPLSAVELNLQLLQKQSLTSEGDAKISGPSTMALYAIRSMKDLIQSLLDQAKMEAGTFELELTPGSMTDIVGDVIKVLEPLAAKKHIQIKVETQAEIPTIRLDRRKMSQVISNILGNAIKFTPSGGKIGIQISSGNHVVGVSISDTGPGIPEDQKDLVFERFWQPSSTRNQGTGLGLAIAKAVIEAHHGRIWIEGATGQGSTFHWTIPTNLSELQHTKRSA